MTLCLGLMSGTSMDGIDIALLKTDGQTQVKSMGGCFFAYPPVFQALLKAAECAAYQANGDKILAALLFTDAWHNYTTNQLQLNTATLALYTQDALTYLNQQLQQSASQLSLAAVIHCSTQLHLKACHQLLQQLAIPITTIDVIGYHGQTLYHKPSAGISWQAGDPQYLANALHCKVIGHFRQADIDHGGQGAPLVPLYHHALIQAEGLFPAVIINCGGISNMTIVAGQDLTQVSAFDAGPGNVLLDRLIKQASFGAQSFDQDGQLALTGTLSHDLLMLLLDNALPPGFLTQAPPKSLDSHDCHLPAAIESLATADALATLAAFTAECLVVSLSLALPANLTIKHVILAGGGWHHPVILREFQQRLVQQWGDSGQICTAKQLGWQQDLLEAEAFAYLAKRSLCHLPLSMPLTTGVALPQTGGMLFTPQPTTN